MTSNDGTAPNGVAPTRLLFVRHGRTEHNVGRRLTGWGDTELDAMGLAQARLVGRHVAGQYPVTHVFSSPLKRAFETARSIAQECKLPVEPLDDLREIWFGDCEGMTEEEIAELHPEAWAQSRDLHDLTFGWPGGENRVQFNTRVRTTVDRIVAATPGGVAVVATHGGFISNLLSQIERGTGAYWPEYQVHNASITEIEAAGGGRFSIVRHNDVSFLPDAAHTWQRFQTTPE